MRAARGYSHRAMGVDRCESAYPATQEKCFICMMQDPIVGSR